MKVIKEMKGMKGMKYKFFIILLVNVGISIPGIQVNFTNTASFVSTYFPTDEWRTISPEEVNINSARLLDMEEDINNNIDIGVDSIHIVKDGFLIYEKYYDYYNYSSIHQMSSTTKSITSILVGISNASGYITNLDEPILNIFSDRVFNNTNERKKAITIRHLLKMQSGIQWNEENVPFFTQPIDPHNYSLFTNTSDVLWENYPFNPEANWRQMILSPDWIQFVLDRPMQTAPGTVFYYHSGDSHLLSAIIKKKTGMNTEVFARKKLFDPLGINNYLWFNDSTGITMGAFGLWLTPYDMTKIGYLFLNNGTWNGNQIIPIEWVQESTYPYQFLTKQSFGYGYQWWLEPPLNLYYTMGGGGQYIIVKTDANLVVAITASKYIEDHSYVLNRVFRDHILKLLEVEISTTTEEMSSTQPTEPTEFSNLFFFFSLGMLVLIRWKKNNKE